MGHSGKTAGHLVTGWLVSSEICAGGSAASAGLEASLLCLTPDCVPARLGRELHPGLTSCCPSGALGRCGFNPGFRKRETGAPGCLKHGNGRGAYPPTLRKIRWICCTPSVRLAGPG